MVNDNCQVMGDEKETSLLVGLISDERDTSFIIELSLPTGNISYLWNIQVRLDFYCANVANCWNYKRWLENLKRYEWCAIAEC